MDSRRSFFEFFECSGYAMPSGDEWQWFYANYDVEITINIFICRFESDTPFADAYIDVFLNDPHSYGDASPYRIDKHTWELIGKLPAFIYKDVDVDAHFTEKAENIGRHIALRIDYPHLHPCEYMVYSPD